MPFIVGDEPISATFESGGGLAFYNYTFITDESGNILTDEDGALLYSLRELGANAGEFEVGNEPTSATFSSGDMI